MDYKEKEEFLMQHLKATLLVSWQSQTNEGEDILGNTDQYNVPNKVTRLYSIV